MRLNLHPKIFSSITRTLKMVAAMRIGLLVAVLISLGASLPPPDAQGGGLAISDVARRGVDLLERYPTRLTAGDTSPEGARSWGFTNADVFRVSQFSLEVGKALKIEVGLADLGIGHCGDGAVWAVLIPRQGGELTSSATNRQETISHVWLRFHPREISRLFPPGTVFADGATNLVSQMRRIANYKMNSSWQSNGRAMIPEPKDRTVDVDTQEGPRRFFVVDTIAATAEYIAPFEREAVKPLPQLTVDAAEAAFDQLWEAFDRKYAIFVLRPEVDWTKLRGEYRPKAIASKSTSDFAEVCAAMLKPLRDLHVWLKLAGEYVPVFNRPRTVNSNPSAHRTILGSLHQESSGVQWAVTDGEIGFVAIYGWNGPDTPSQCQAALERMRSTRGLIVDVRLNGGGSEDRAMEFAGRFLKQEFVYAYSQFRNGPGHTNLTEKLARKMAPRGPWRYDRPVILLIGQKCMSSNESFIGMMTGCPQVTTMGDHTCGSSGNPETVFLPLEMTVSVPKWIDYLPDGTPLDERGFQPQVPFTPTPGAFEGNRDDLLSAALERLRQVPLPDKPIAGLAFTPDEEVEAQDESRPKVISVVPASGTKSVEPVTELRVRFDRPMNPLALKLNWESGGFLDCEFPQYDPGKHEFRIPVHLLSGTTHEVVVNKLMGFETMSKERTDFPRDGFQSANHRLARRFDWRFRTLGKAPPADGKPPRILKISPTPGSQVPYRTFLEVQFDQPMKSPTEALPYLTQTHGLKEAALIQFFQYDAESHTFRLPLVLMPKEKATFTLNGFHSAAGVAAEPIKIEFQVSDKNLSKADRDRFETETKNPRLLQTLESMREKRAKTYSLAERVQTVSLSQQDGRFTELKAESASFKWQSPDQYHADATDMMQMCNAFVIGCDGQNWWWHRASARSTNFVVCPVKEVAKLNICLCDPFDLMHETPRQAASEQGLIYVGATKLGGTVCHFVESWNVDDRPNMTPIGSLTRWCIDSETGRPLSVTSFYNSFLMGTRFLYDVVNQPLPAEDFGIPKISGLTPAPPEPLGAGYTNRFINLRDGSDGRTSLRWGKEGPKGRSSSGLN